VLESVPEHGYGCDDGNVYARGRHGILIANARASCRSIVPVSVIEESSQNTVALENGSANGDDHVHDCGHVLWQMLAEHRMKPFYAHPRVRSSLKLAQRSPTPACISSGPCSRNLFLRRAGSLSILWHSNCSSKMLVLVVYGSSCIVVAFVRGGLSMCRYRGAGERWGEGWC
jgi:hypothetical protein